MESVSGYRLSSLPEYLVCHIPIAIGIEAVATGIGIPASSISVLYRSIPVPDWGTLIPEAVRHEQDISNAGW